MNGKTLALELCRTWENLLSRQTLDPEIAYRLRKMADRLYPVVDRIFFKTLLAEDLLRECLHRTASLETGFNAPDETIFLQLTGLEKTCQELLRKTQEFRVKAG